MPAVSRVRLRLAVAAIVALTGLVSEALAEEAAAPTVAPGKKVSLEYTLKLDDGSVADTNVGGQPLVYEQGAGKILPALEQELSGLAVGDTKQVTLPPAQGYGEIDEALVHTVSASQIPEEARKAGAQLMAQAPNGQQRPVRVREVKGEEIVLDMNHPLAGQTLHFDVKVLAVE